MAPPGGGGHKKGNVPAALVENEGERLAALRALRVLDSATPKDLQWLVEVCSQVFQVPICLVSLVEDSRQWFWSAWGLDAKQTGREESFCAHAMLSREEIFVVLDTWEDERFANNVLVTGFPNIRFYAGMPLNIQMAPPRKRGARKRGGGQGSEQAAPEAAPPVELCMGTLCLIDDRPHKEFTANERKMLQVLSRLAADALQSNVPWRSRPYTSSSGDQCGLTNVATRKPSVPSELLQFSHENGALLILGQGEESGGDEAAAPVLVCTPGLERVLRRSIANTVGKDFRDILFPDEDADGGAAGPGPGREDSSGYLRRSAFTTLVQSLVRDAAEAPVEALGARGELEGWMPREAPPTGPGGRVWAHLDIKTVGDGQLLVLLQDRTRSALELQTAKLGMANAEAAALAKSRFLANMSHELRTPMNAINACSLLLSEEHLTVAQAELVQMIGMSCTQMLDLLNQVLDFSKLDSKRMESGVTKRVSEPFNGRQCVEKVLESLVILANRKGIELGYVLENGVSDTWVGDEIQFRQVLVNLASNAVKFTERGHVCIYVKRLAGGGGGAGSSGGSSDEEEWLEVQVKDTGKGVAPEALEVIFHPFEQVDSSLTRDISGTGLGLSISKMIVEGLGGQIKAQSVVGRGSTFTCTFPFRATNAQKRKEDAADPSLAECGEALLVIRSPVMAETVGSILTRMGLRYRSVIPNQVSQLLAEEGSASRYELVILDHHSNGGEISRAWIDCARVVIPWAKAAALAKESSGVRGRLPVLLLQVHRYPGTNPIPTTGQAVTKDSGRPCSSEPTQMITVPSDVSIASAAAAGAKVRESPLLDTWNDLWRGLPCFKLFKPMTLVKMNDILQQMRMPSKKRNRLSGEAGGQESPTKAAGGTHGAAALRSRGGSRLDRNPEKVRILVCEDNMVNQRVLTKILESLGYSDVTLANNGAEGLKAVQESAFNLVLMDIHMPVMDGLQACKEITHPGTPCMGGAPPPVVALTADVVSDIRERCGEVGMVGYLKKPIDRSELAETITRHSRMD